jgi:glyoxylase-like metal-dependent hydrolase (beta-lactamase superfamily II)
VAAFLRLARHDRRTVAAILRETSLRAGSSRAGQAIYGRSGSDPRTEEHMLNLKPLETAAHMRIDRRRFIVGAAGLATAAASWPVRLWAAEAPHSFKQGDFEVTVVSDGHLVLPTGIVAPNAPPEELKAILEAAGVTGDQIMPATNAVVIRAGSDVILFDTGSGPDFQPTAGKLEENLKAAGIDPASITKVALSHAHPDHIWGNVTAEGGLRYPNAAYYVSAAEWDFWTAPDLASKMPKEMEAFVLGAQKHLNGVKDRVTMVKGGDEIVTGIRVLDTAGHTPGHISFEVAGGEGLILTYDSIAVPAVFFPHPEWHFGFDADPELAARNRAALLDRAATDKIKMLGFHWPYPGVGFAERKDNAYAFTAAG